MDNKQNIDRCTNCNATHGDSWKPFLELPVDVINDYISGKSLNSLSKEFNVSKRFLSKYLCYNKVSIRKSKNKKEQDKKWCQNCRSTHDVPFKSRKSLPLEIVQLYNDGYSLNDLSLKYKVDSVTISRYLCSKDVIIRRIKDAVSQERSRNKISERFSGRPITEDTKRRISAANTGRFRKDNPSNELLLQRGRIIAYRTYDIPNGHLCECWCECSNESRSRSHLNGDTSDNRQENIGLWCNGCNINHGPPAWSSKYKVEPNITKMLDGARIGEIAKYANLMAKNKGWWDRPRSDLEICALIHSEISEAVESFRKDEPLFYMKGDKPEGAAVELCDALIRIFDWFGHNNIDLNGIIHLKMKYNETRPYRHGNKKA